MSNNQKRSIGVRLGMAAVVLVIAVISWYLGTRNEVNPVTGEEQRVALSVEQEIALGLQARPEMVKEFGGMEKDQAEQERVDRIGAKIVRQSKASQSPYKFEFHVLEDDNVINAFALPGGQVFITDALLDKLSSDDEVAGVLAHEISHVVARHGARQMAREKLTDGLSQAAVIAAYDPSDPSTETQAKIAQAIAALVGMKYSRGQELESDRLGVCFMMAAGYNSEGLIEVMRILDAASKGQRPPEFMSTHPGGDSRIEEIKAAREHCQE
ncbi:MAG: M48 family metalloprotease [Leptospiraceae bacterium]|nr:M48 family metalloprotease [Leptospiraceae bacterium]